MKYLCGKYNLTAAIYSVFWNDYNYVNKNNEIVGRIGKYMNRLVKPNDLSLCKYYNQEHVGKKLSNGSYDGAIGQLIKKSIDLFLKPELPFFDTELIDSTPVFTSEDYLVAHAIDEKARTKQMDRELFLESFDLPYLAYSLIALIAFFCLASLFFYYKKTFDSKHQSSKIRKSIHLVSNFIIDDYMDMVPYKTLIVFFFVTYMFITKQIVSINIKTTKVVVDTSSMITSEEALFRSPKKAGWLEGERDIFLAQTSPKGTFLYNLYNPKNENPPAILVKSPNKKLIDGHENSFTFMNEFELRILGNFLVGFFQMKYFINPKPFYSNYNVLYRKKEKSDKMNYIDEFFTRSFEFGLFQKIMDDLKNAKLLKQGDKKEQIYNDVDSYIKDNSFIESINLDNFLYIFIAYFGFLFVVLIIFLTHHLANRFLFQNSENCIGIRKNNQRRPIPMYKTIPMRGYKPIYLNPKIMAISKLTKNQNTKPELISS